MKCMESDEGMDRVADLTGVDSERWVDVPLRSDAEKETDSKEYGDPQPSEIGSMAITASCLEGKTGHRTATEQANRTDDHPAKPAILEPA